MSLFSKISEDAISDRVLKLEVEKLVTKNTGFDKAEIVVGLYEMGAVVKLVHVYFHDIGSSVGNLILSALGFLTLLALGLAEERRTHPDQPLVDMKSVLLGFNDYNNRLPDKLSLMLEYTSELNALSRTYRSLYSLAHRRLYDYFSKDYSPKGFKNIVKRKNIDALRKILPVFLN